MLLILHKNILRQKYISFILLKLHFLSVYYITWKYSYFSLNNLNHPNFQNRTILEISIHIYSKYCILYHTKKNQSTLIQLNWHNHLLLCAAKQQGYLLSVCLPDKVAGSWLTCDGEQTLLGRSVHGVWYFFGLFFMGKQQGSSQSSSQPQSHSSPISTTPLPHMAFWGSVKQPLESRALELRTLLICRSEHGENLLLFFLSPDVALRCKGKVVMKGCWKAYFRHTCWRIMRRYLNYVTLIHQWGT